MSRAVEEYLKPDVVQQIARLDLRAKFIVKGFLQGLHASPFQGFSVEFSEHRRYAAGDDPKDIDWLVYAKTDKHYIKKYEAETNITGYLVVDTRSVSFLTGLIMYMMAEVIKSRPLLHKVSDFVPPRGKQKRWRSDKKARETCLYR